MSGTPLVASQEKAGTIFHRNRARGWPHVYMYLTYFIDSLPYPLSKRVFALDVKSNRSVTCNYHFATLKRPCIYDGFFFFFRR